MPTKKAPAKRKAKQPETVRIYVERTRTVSKSLLAQHYFSLFPKGYTATTASPLLLEEMGINQQRFTRLLKGSPLLADELLAYCRHFKAYPETIVQLTPTQKGANHD